MHQNTSTQLRRTFCPLHVPNTKCTIARVFTWFKQPNISPFHRSVIIPIFNQMQCATFKPKQTRLTQNVLKLFIPTLMTACHFLNLIFSAMAPYVLCWQTTQEKNHCSFMKKKCYHHKSHHNYLRWGELCDVCARVCASVRIEEGLEI